MFIAGERTNPKCALVTPATAVPGKEKAKTTRTGRTRMKTATKAGQFASPSSLG